MARQSALHQLEGAPARRVVSAVKQTAAAPEAAAVRQAASGSAENSCGCNEVAAPESTEQPTAQSENGCMQCSVCQWIYDPALGEPMQDVTPGTMWSDVPDSFLCPECGLGKDVFNPIR